MHLPTLKSIIHNKETQDPSTDVKLVLLAILTLTARLHPDLIRFASHRTGSRQDGSLPGASSFAASEYFADLLIRALGPLECALTKGSVTRVQVYLTLSRYRWSQPNGGSAAWMYLGVAIRMAQGLGMSVGGRHRKVQRTTKLPETIHLSLESWTAQEINRRTIFSCLILDYFLSSGFGRVSMMNLDGLQIPMPSDEYSFNVGRPTVVYRHPDAAVMPNAQRRMLEYPVDESLWSYFVRLADLWAAVNKYCLEGGRCTEVCLPWHRDTAFHQLDIKIQAFYANLPTDFTWSGTNFWKHDNSLYVSLHMLGALCRIMLHREYVPFIAIKCSKPIGPLDNLISNLSSSSDEFWHRSAREFFNAGREIIDMTKICRDKLPRSPLVTFAIWQATVGEVYMRHFPHMDMVKNTCGTEETREVPITELGVSTGDGVARDALRRDTCYSEAASEHLANLLAFDRYLTKVVNDYKHWEAKRTDGEEPEVCSDIMLDRCGERRVSDGKPTATTNGTVANEHQPNRYAPAKIDEWTPPHVESSIHSPKNAGNKAWSLRLVLDNTPKSTKPGDHRGRPVAQDLPAQSTSSRSHQEGPATVSIGDDESDTIGSYVEKYQGQRLGVAFEDLEGFAGQTETNYGFEDGRSAFFLQLARSDSLPHFGIEEGRSSQC